MKFNISNEVAIKELSEVVNIDGGYAFKSDEFVQNKTPIIRIGNIVDGNVEIDYSIGYDTKNKNLDKYLIKKNNILIAMSGATTGKLAMYRNNDIALLNQRVGRFNVIDNNMLYNDYLYYYLRSDFVQGKIKVMASGCAQPNISPKQLLSIHIPVPPLEAQKKIVKVLEKAEKALEKRKEAIRLLDELVKSRFVEMFGDPINNPVGWEVKKLKNISTKILSGNTPKGGSEVYVDDGIMFFRSQNVWKNRLVLDDIAYIDKETHKKMLKSSLKHRDILMTKTGRINTENSSLGRASMYLGEDDGANINGHVYLIRLKEEILNEFILFILTSKEYRGYIRSVCVGGIDKRQLNKEHIEEFPIIFPPIEKQKKFVNFVNQVDKLKFEMQKSLEEMENNFNSLMQDAFNGKLEFKQ